MYTKIFELAKTAVPNARLLEHRGQYTIALPDKASIILLLTTLKQNPVVPFDMLLDITAIDWATPKHRFDIIYFLYSNSAKLRLRMKAPVEASDCHLPTATGLYPSADWYEREVWDMYGITFEGHPDMRRFYMPEDFYNKDTGEQYHPLRKDFPLTGVPDSLPLPPFPERTGEEVKF